MGRELQRAFLWMIFLLALFMLWDAWQVRNGNQSFFGTPEAVQEQVVENANTTAAAGDVKVPADSKAVASEVNVTITQPVVVTTDLFKITFDANGASVARAELLKERQTPDWKTRGLPGLILGEEEQQDAGNVVLFDTSAQHVYKAETGLVGGNFTNHRAAFRLISDTLDMKEGQDTLNVSFAASQGNVELIKTYVFHRGHYGIDVKHEVRNKGNVAISPSVYMQLTRDDGKVASDSAFYNTFTGPAAYTEAEKFQKIDFDSIADNDTDLPSQSNEGWIAMLQHYFLTAWVPQQDINRELYTRQLDKHLYAIGSIVAVGEVAPGAEKVVDSTLYVGPQDQRRLEYIAPNLDLVVDYGWLTFLAKPIYWLLAFLQGLVGNWGWAIVLLTVLVKAILYPISAAGYKSMARMRDVAPRMKAIQEKYGNDKQALNQAMMELYRREKINPAGGCFPILLQIPVFLALYWVLLATVELRGASWLLWVNDSDSPDPSFILPLFIVATLIINMTIRPPQTDQTKAIVMLLMPDIIVLMLLFFASFLFL